MSICRPERYSCVTVVQSVKDFHIVLIYIIVVNIFVAAEYVVVGVYLQSNSLFITKGQRPRDDKRVHEKCATILHGIFIIKFPSFVTNVYCQK